MCNFNKHNEDTKTFLHLLMQKYAEMVGGANFILGLIEAIKEKKPNALINSACKVDSKELNIRWNKIIFKDKFDILEEIIRSHKSSEDLNFNILQSDSQKKKKKILNMVKTLAPIEFKITVKNSEDLTGFSFKIFETVEDDSATINPIFATLFFCSTEYMKKALKYEIYDLDVTKD
ncbi:hypothetical protein [Sulfurimonas sp.]|uniref:hypothetical protein n=1 Tax=Sulfurimonas sp. TaxID=2022749 RepID=UPI0025E5D685|nr:hypothetical protein [Sulfurimonas sp.]MCK9472209.1 hypothetical protein [Sulfurimonas sp.]MDD3506234.1 hypothetical protein [Sulfurimonas sp.]